MKQELLELRSERARLVRLEQLLERAALVLAREREVRESASGNGKASPQWPDTTDGDLFVAGRGR